MRDGIGGDLAPSLWGDGKNVGPRKFLNDLLRKKIQFSRQKFINF